MEKVCVTFSELMRFWILAQNHQCLIQWILLPWYISLSPIFNIVRRVPLQRLCDLFILLKRMIGVPFFISKHRFGMQSKFIECKSSGGLIFCSTLSLSSEHNV